MTDTEWAEQLKTSPKQAYEVLIDRYGSLVYAIVLNKIGGCASREDIEDCVSDIFAEIFRTAHGYSADSGSLKAFVSTIAKHRAIDVFRRLSGKYAVGSSIDDENTVLPPAADNTEEEAEKRITNAELWKTVSSLGEPDASIIVYQYFYGLTVRETAKRLKMSSAAVQKRSIRARKKIKQIMGKGERND